MKKNKRNKPYKPKPINMQGFINIVRLTDQALEYSCEQKTKDAKLSCENMHNYFNGFIQAINDGGASLELKAPILLMQNIFNTLFKAKQFYYCIDDVQYASDVYKAFNIAFEYFWTRTTLENKLYFEENEYDIFTTTLEFMCDRFLFLTNADYSFIYEYAIAQTKQMGYLTQKENEND